MVEQETKKRNMQWKVIKLRTDKNLTRKYVAEEILGISADAYGNKERGQHPFKAEEIYKLCQYFEVGFDDVFLP